MTTLAERLLSDFKTLAPEEQIWVRERVISLTQSIQEKALQNLLGASKDKQLLSKLLADRAGERARG